MNLVAGSDLREIAFGEVVGKTGLFVDGDWVESKDQDPNGDVRLIQLADIGEGEYLNKSARFLTSEKVRELRCTLLKPGDLLVARMPDPLGRACIFPGDAKPCVTAVDVCIVRPDRHLVDVEWLKWAVNSPDFRQRLVRFTTGTTRKRISRTNLQSISLTLPYLAKQRHIAAILDKADAIRRKRRESIELLEEFLRSAFLEMFGDPVRNEKGWPTQPMGERVEIVGGGTPSRKIKSYFGGDICWATSKDMRLETISNTQEHITAEAVERSATKLIAAGAILVVVKSKILMHRLPVALTLVPLCINQDIKAIVTSAGLSARYLARHMRLGERALLGKARGANTEGLTLEHLRKYKVMRPPSDTVAAFEQIETQIAAIRAEAKAHFAESDALFNSLAQRAFRGEL